MLNGQYYLTWLNHTIATHAEFHVCLVEGSGVTVSENNGSTVRFPSAERHVLRYRFRVRNVRIRWPQPFERGSLPTLICVCFRFVT